MSRSEEYGPWVAHDGGGCPLPLGTMVQCTFETWPFSYITPEGASPVRGGRCWDWRHWLCEQPDGSLVARIVSYRVRKPRGMAVLEHLVAEIATEDAA